MGEFEYNDIVVKELIEYIERDLCCGLHYIQPKEIVDTKLIDLFDDDQRIRTTRNNWCSYYVVLDNNKLLIIHYNNHGKYDDRPTKFIFELYSDADKCCVLFEPDPGAYSNNMRVIDSKGHDIDNLQYVENKSYRIAGSYSLDLDMSSIGTEFLVNLIRPTSIEQIKERAKKPRTR